MTTPSLPPVGNASFTSIASISYQVPIELRRIR